MPRSSQLSRKLKKIPNTLCIPLGGTAVKKNAPSHWRWVVSFHESLCEYLRDGKETDKSQQRLYCQVLELKLKNVINLFFPTRFQNIHLELGSITTWFMNLWTLRPALSLSISRFHYTVFSSRERATRQKQNWNCDWHMQMRSQSRLLSGCTLTSVSVNRMSKFRL